MWFYKFEIHNLKFIDEQNNIIDCPLNAVTENQVIKNYNFKNFLRHNTPLEEICN